MSAITASTRSRSSVQRVATLVGLAGLGLVAIIVALGNAIARAPAGAIDVGPRSLAPNPYYLFGTDGLGRDILSETVHALGVTFSTALIATVVVVLAGAVAGFAVARAPFRSGVFLRTVTGVLGAVPILVLAVIVVSIAGHGFAAIAVGLAAAPVAFNRSFDRAALLAQSRHAVYARATGIPAMTLLRRDLVYEVRGNVASVAARALASTIIAMATLSFFGFGAMPSHRDLGLLIADARASYLHMWWPAFFPALVLGLLILFARLAAGLDEGEPP
jgi:peptide/nickel transport system permease protein